MTNSLWVSSASAAVLLACGSASAQTTVYADQFGYDPNDATSALQSAINSSADTIIVRKMSSAWNVNPITLKSNQKLIFEPGVEVMALPGYTSNQRLFSANGLSNLHLEGYGATFRMRRNEYVDADETRHALWIRESSNITIKGLAFKDSGGDGIYLGAGTTPVTNVTIRDVLADNNKRQGMTISNANGVTVTHSTFRTTNGVPPAAGIDLEPSREHHQISNILIADSLIEHNGGYGVTVSTQHLVASMGSQPVSATFRNLEIRKIAGPGIYLYFGSDASVETDLRFENVRVWDTVGEGLLIRQKSKDRGTLSFKGLQLEDVANGAAYPILLEDLATNGADPMPETLAFGGIDFGTEAGIGSLPSEVVDDMDRPAMAIAGYLDDELNGTSTSNGLWDVSGQLYVDNPFGAELDLGSNLHNVTLTLHTGQAPIPAPEPASLGLVTLGLGGLAVRRVRR